MDEIMKDLVVLVEAGTPVDHMFKGLDKHSTAYTVIYSDEPAGKLLARDFHTSVNGYYNGTRVFTTIGNLRSWLRQVGANVEPVQAPQMPEYNPEPVGLMDLMRGANEDAHAALRRDMEERAARIHAMIAAGQREVRAQPVYNQVIMDDLQ